MTPNQRRQAVEICTTRVSVELTNVCNLRCGYCMRDDEQLYHTPANFFPAELLRKVVRGAREAYGAEYVSFTGGEPTLHPRFAEIVETVRDEGSRFAFVTNGWHFDRVLPVLLKNREALRVVAFSVDGATREAHDRWRGEGSFVRLVRAVAKCHAHAIPFSFKAPIRRDTVPQLEALALLAARLGAMAIDYSHLLPTSAEFDRDYALTREERAHAEQEIGVLGSILRLRIGVVAGFYDVDPAAPCAILRGVASNVDYRGRLTLCCNIAGYRGADGSDADVAADLNREDFATAFARLRRISDEQIERRRATLAEHAARGVEPDLFVGSPCLFCLQSFGKIPWHAGGATARQLPVLVA
ncbi:MAG: radical SAM protein [Acidobacteria bacterium]|nr:radical SAM protein [Acidobacteriota bacterium]